MLERERERKKREKERKKERARERGADPGREKRKKRQQAKEANATPDLPRPGGEVLAAGARKRKKENPGRPRERNGEEEGGREEKGRTKPRNRGPQSPKNGEKRGTPLISIRKTIQKRAPRTSKNPSETNKRSSMPKTLRKKPAVTKIELRKNKPKKGRTFLRRFWDAKKGIFMAKKTSRKTPDSHSKVRCEKPSDTKNLRQTELWKNRKVRRDSHRKKHQSRKTDRISPSII